MKKYDKPALSYEQQVYLLQRRGMLVNDLTKATKFLSQVSYHRFSTYFLPFQVEKDKFIQGCTFDSVVRLYSLDEDLRTAFFPVLAQIEIALRTRFVYGLAHGWGAFAHYSPDIVRSDFNHYEWLAALEKEIGRAREPFIEHYKLTYEEFPRLPLWMAVEVMSLGSLSALYNGLQPEPRRRIIEGLDVPHPVFRSWLHFLSYLRNVCAHHSRLWDRELAIRPEIPRKDPHWRKLSIGNTRIFCSLPVIETINTWCLIDDSKFNDVKKNLLSISSIDPRFSKKMGIPQLWKGEKCLT